MIRTLAVLSLAGFALLAQDASAQAADPIVNERHLSEWVAELKAPAPLTRNAAAYTIGGLGPAASSAVPALIEALNDPVDAVRYPVCVALREIGPGAIEAVPALTEMLDDRNDDIASMARKAIKAITGVDPRPPEE